MAAAGVELLADLDRLAVLGFAEVVRHLPDLASLRRLVRGFLVDQGVDLLVPIDYPGFNLALARFARRRGIPVLYYIAPQVWAWHESRAKRLASDTDLVCAVLPFERPFLERWGARVRFVGHPLLDRAPPGTGGSGEASPLLGLFPGSRVQEVRRMLPPFLGASRRLKEEHPELKVVIARAEDLPISLYETRDGADLARPEAVAAEATAALTKSGTITLQLAISGVPMVVAYRMSPISYAIARRLVTVEHMALVNLVAGRSLVPELVQAEVTPAALAEAVAPFLRPGEPRRESVVTGLAGVTRQLGRPGAASRVADECVRLLEAAP
jgi:lipid-A-disaccharide synthase